MDTLRLAVTPASGEAGGGFQVEIYVNDVEMTASGAGMGMDPYDVLVPTNRFVAGDEPTTIPVARCGCGDHGCGKTDVTISRDGDVVRWAWEIEVPMDRAVTFAADAYTREVDRIASDRSWETPDRTAGRLVLSTIDGAELPDGLRFDWVANDWEEAEVFRVCLRAGDRYQVFVDFEWLDRTPEELAQEVRRVLVEVPPADWSARWLAMRPTSTPPPMAGDGCRPEE